MAGLAAAQGKGRGHHIPGPQFSPVTWADSTAGDPEGRITLVPLQARVDVEGGEAILPQKGRCPGPQRFK